MAKLKFKEGDYIVEVTQRKREDEGDEIVLDVLATAQLDAKRKHIAGWIFGTKPSQVALCNRLKNCIEALKAFESYNIETDINGNTYVSKNTSEHICLFGRYLNGDLKTLGF